MVRRPSCRRGRSSLGVWRGCSAGVWTRRGRASRDCTARPQPRGRRRTPERRIRLGCCGARRRGARAVARARPPARARMRCGSARRAGPPTRSIAPEGDASAFIGAFGCSIAPVSPRLRRRAAERRRVLALGSRRSLHQTGTEARSPGAGLAGCSTRSLGWDLLYDGGRFGIGPTARLPARLSTG